MHCSFVAVRESGYGFALGAKGCGTVSHGTGPPGDNTLRRRAESNRRTGLCRPLPIQSVNLEAAPGFEPG
jgi:hypothetical protein